MIVAHSLTELFHAIEQLMARSLALVPTMGALHEGHIALVKKAKKVASHCIVTVFVNPLQFDQQDDFLRYPKIENDDIELLQQNQVDLVWFPRVEDIYPPGFATRIVVDGPALSWEGDVRKGHFSGVATVVYRLFSLIRPDYACFGEKDWQQLQVIRQMVRDLMLSVSLVNVPTVREESGLAKSSRNRFLTIEEAKKAPLLYKTLREAHQDLQNGKPIPEVLQKAVQDLENAGFRVDYFKAVNGNSLKFITEWEADSRLITAARLGSVRLLDNI